MMDSGDEPEPDDTFGTMWREVPESGPDDALAEQRHREYVRGRRYEVWVSSPFARNPRYQGGPVLRTRYYVGRTDDGEPIFASEDEWHALALREQAAELRAEGYRAPEQWLTLREIAAEVGKSERTIRRHIVERGECPFTAFGRTKKVRRSDLDEWLAKDRPETREIRETEQYRRDDF